MVVGMVVFIRIMVMMLMIRVVVVRVGMRVRHAASGTAPERARLLHAICGIQEANTITAGDKVIAALLQRFHVGDGA